MTCCGGIGRGALKAPNGKAARANSNGLQTGTPSESTIRPRITRKILVLGKTGAGKSKFIESVSKMQIQSPGVNNGRSTSSDLLSPFPSSDGNEFIKPQPTQGFFMQQIPYSIFRLSFLEVGGVYRKYWGKYTNGVHGLVYVIDGTSNSVHDDAQALEEFLVENSEARNWPIVILVTKADKWQSSEDALHSCETAIANRSLLATLGKGDRRIFPVASFSSNNYSTVTAETNVRGALDWFVSALLSSAT